MTRSGVKAHFGIYFTPKNAPEAYKSTRGPGIADCLRMSNRSKSLGILSIGFMFSFGGCDPADAGGDTTQSAELSPSDELQEAVVIADPYVSGNLLIFMHDPGNSCAHPYGPDFKSYTSMSISLAPALQAIGKYPVCAISRWQAQSCTDGPQCTGYGTLPGQGDATIEITSINGSQLQFTVEGLHNCTYPFDFDPNSLTVTGSSWDGTYTAPRCD